jgi:hypothetical protein
MHKVYAIFGTALSIFFFYACQSGIRILDWDSTPHTRPVGAALHHK